MDSQILKDEEMILERIKALKKPTDQAVKEVVPVLEEQFKNLQVSRKSIKQAIVLIWNLFISKLKSKFVK